MSEQSSTGDLVMANRNLRTGWMVAGIAFGMLGLSFAAVPLYDLFCRSTGYGGTPMVATQPASRIGNKNYTIRFDAGVAPGLNWRFDAEVQSVDVKPGQVVTVHYTVRNNGPVEATGIASFNVLPEIIGGYFNKLQCFCYTEQTMKPGETREESVVFFIDPDIEKDASLGHVQTMTLSYTFFPVKTPVKPIAANDSKSGIAVR